MSELGDLWCALGVLHRMRLNSPFFQKLVADATRSRRPSAAPRRWPRSRGRWRLDPQRYFGALSNPMRAAQPGLWRRSVARRSFLRVARVLLSDRSYPPDDPRLGGRSMRRAPVALTAPGLDGAKQASRPASAVSSSGHAAM